MVNLLFTVSTAEGGLVLVLEDLIIREDHRGNGSGTALLRHAVEFAKQNGCARITLVTDRSNQEVIRFYEKHGFEVSSSAHMRLALGNGTSS